MDGGAHSTEESGAAGTVRQESDTESVASVNEATVPAPRVGSRRRRLVLVGANPPPNHVAEEVDLTVADSPSESGDSSVAVAEEVVHDHTLSPSPSSFKPVFLLFAIGHGEAQLGRHFSCGMDRRLKLN